LLKFFNQSLGFALKWVASKADVDESIVTPEGITSIGSMAIVIYPSNTFWLTKPVNSSGNWYASLSHAQLMTNVALCLLTRNLDTILAAIFRAAPFKNENR